MLWPSSTVNDWEPDHRIYTCNKYTRQEQRKAASDRQTQASRIIPSMNRKWDPNEACLNVDTLAVVHASFSLSHSLALPRIHLASPLSPCIPHLSSRLSVAAWSWCPVDGFIRGWNSCCCAVGSYDKTKSQATTGRSST